MVTSRTKPAQMRLKVLSLALFTLASLLPGVACAEIRENDATKILKQMSDYLAGQKTIAASFDSSIEIVTTDLEKIQFNSSGKLLFQRPNKLRVSRTGGFSDLELTFDGKTATIFGKNLNVFAQLDMTGSTDQLLDRVHNEYAIQTPGTDLLLPDVFTALTEDAVEAKHIGTGVIDGIECEHLAFRNADTDWQLWIEAGPKPIPRKLVITSKTVPGAPQYTLLIRKWHTDETTEAGNFAFTPPAGAKKLDLKAFTTLSDADEVPAGIAKGDEQ